MRHLGAHWKIKICLFKIIQHICLFNTDAWVKNISHKQLTPETRTTSRIQSQHNTIQHNKAQQNTTDAKKLQLCKLIYLVKYFATVKTDGLNNKSRLLEFVQDKISYLNRLK